jgi:hypothetical protein
MVAPMAAASSPWVGPIVTDLPRRRSQLSVKEGMIRPPTGTLDV